MRSDHRLHFKHIAHSKGWGTLHSWPIVVSLVGQQLHICIVVHLAWSPRNAGLLIWTRSGN